MHINSIQNKQLNFNGMLLFKNSRIVDETNGWNTYVVDEVAMPAENLIIKDLSRDGLKGNISKHKPEKVKKIWEENDLYAYPTRITTPIGEEYFVKPTINEVLDAYKAVAYTNKVIEVQPKEMESIISKYTDKKVKKKK